MHRLFMQDSESPRTLRRLLTLLILIIIALPVSDWLLGRVLSRVSIEPPFILRFENVPGIEAFWKYSEAGIKPIVFTGSSQVYTGISPHAFNDRIKATTGQEVHALNISILGSLVTIEKDLISNLILPAHPQIVLYGIEMRALFPPAQVEGDPTSFVADFNNRALGYAVSRPSEIERNLQLWLLQHSNWIRYQDNLREWLTGTRQMNVGDYIQSGVDDLGYAPFPNNATQNTANISQFIPFSTTDRLRQMMVDIGTTCKQSGVQCILLNMPLHDVSYQYIKPEEEALYRELLKLPGLPIWDFNTEACRTALGDASFFNMNHLNSNGAVIYSQMIADLYAKVFFKASDTGTASCATISP